MGEFTISSLAQFKTFPVYIQYVSQNKAYQAAALTLVAFGMFVVLGLMMLVYVPLQRVTSRWVR